MNIRSVVDASCVQWNKGNNRNRKKLDWHASKVNRRVSELYLLLFTLIQPANKFTTINQPDVNHVPFVDWLEYREYILISIINYTPWLYKRLHFLFNSISRDNTNSYWAGGGGAVEIRDNCSKKQITVIKWHAMWTIIINHSRVECIDGTNVHIGRALIVMGIYHRQICRVFRVF